jgi:hypothetical protein
MKQENKKTVLDIYSIETCSDLNFKNLRLEFFLLDTETKLLISNLHELVQLL